MLSLQLSCCRWCCREGQCGWRPHVSAQSFSKLHVLTFSLRFGHPVLHATRRCHLLGWAPHPSRQCRQDFANFGTRFYTVTLAHVANVHDASNNPVSVSQCFLGGKRNTKPWYFLKYQRQRLWCSGALQLTEAPSMERMSGGPFSRCSFVLQPGAEKSVKDIEDHARQVTITRGLVLCINQDIQLLLEGTAHLLPIGGTIWSHRAANARPYWKTYGKTNVGRLQFQQWMEALHSVRLQNNVRRAWQADLTGAREKQDATPGVVAQARREARLATRKRLKHPPQLRKAIWHHMTVLKKHGSLPVVPRKAVVEVSKIENYRWCMDGRANWRTERWLELCFLEWLQWSPHPQLLDVVWCTVV